MTRNSLYFEFNQLFEFDVVAVRVYFSPNYINWRRSHQSSKFNGFKYFGMSKPISSARAYENYFERFEIWWMSRNSMKEEKETVHFLNFVGQEPYALIKNLAFPESLISLPLNQLKEILMRHVQPINFESAERAKFDGFIRGEHQSIRDFILQLQTQAAKCNYSPELQSRLRDRLIVSINSLELQQRRLLRSTPTF